MTFTLVIDNSRKLELRKSGWYCLDDGESPKYWSVATIGERAMAAEIESLRANRDERAKQNGELLAEIERLREANAAKDLIIAERDAELAARGRVIAKLRGLTRG